MVLFYRTNVKQNTAQTQNLGQRGRRHAYGQAVLDHQDGHNQRARSLPVPRARPRERREEADRGHPPVLEGPRNPLISTKAGFDRQAIYVLLFSKQFYRNALVQNALSLSS